MDSEALTRLMTQFESFDPQKRKITDPKKHIAERNRTYGANEYQKITEAHSF